MTVFLGLTGSIGMGKSTTAAMFRDKGVPVHDSDAVVHQLYSGEAVSIIESEFPGTTKDGAVDRALLGKCVVGNESQMKKLESLVHPLVREKEASFRSAVINKEEPLAVLDVPLLFETGGNERVDGIIVVTAPADVQRQRVLARPGMNEEKFRSILERQVPDEEKRRRADFVIDTSLGLEAAERRVEEIILTIRQGWKSKGQNHA